MKKFVCWLKGHKWEYQDFIIYYTPIAKRKTEIAQKRICLRCGKIMGWFDSMIGIWEENR